MKGRRKPTRLGSEGSTAFVPWFIDDGNPSDAMLSVAEKESGPHRSGSYRAKWCGEIPSRKCRERHTWSCPLFSLGPLTMDFETTIPRLIRMISTVIERPKNKKKSSPRLP